MVLAGSCPTDVAPIFFGGRLLALNKKSGGIRPIAIGFTLRRLVAKCASNVGSMKMRSYFSPRQLGVGIPGGCEAAVHAARRFLEGLPVGHVMVKLDFKNAFNSLHRPQMLQAMVDRLPELYAFCYSAYSQPSTLFYGPYRISSQVGPQQGDPIGPLAFCNTIHPLMISLVSDFVVGYLDDLTLGGSVGEVAEDVARILSAGDELGLELNIPKCELITQDDLIVEDNLLSSFIRVPVSETALLGAPLFPGPFLDKAWMDCCTELAGTVQKLRNLKSQDSLILLRASFSAPKVLHLLRCSPSVSHPALHTFDDMLHTAIQHITNSTLSEFQWLQASLPIKEGGLGIRRVASLALPAYLASAASTDTLQIQILDRCRPPADHHRHEYLTSWSNLAGPISVAPSAKQSSWDYPIVLSDRRKVEESLSSPFQRASFLAATAPHSGDWMYALPISSCGLRLDDEAVRVAVGLRLGLDLCVPHQCRCGLPVDARGLHSLVCKHAPGRTARHHAVNDIVARAFSAADIPVSKEPVGLFTTDGKRPDGMTLIPWKGGKPAAWDVTVGCTTADSYVSSSAREAGAVAELAASRKTVKYACLMSDYNFYPIAVETLGTVGMAANELFVDIGRRISAISGEPRETSFLYQRFSVTVQRYNAVLLRDSFAADSLD